MADEVVLLRPWRPEDLSVKAIAFADPLVQRFSWPHTGRVTEADIRQSAVLQEAARLRGEELNFALVEPHDAERVLGGGSVYGIDPSEGRAAVGFWLAPGARGRGVATHATRLMAEWAFDTLGIARLELTCGPDNESSQRVARRCGFVREGTLRSHVRFKGGRRDSVIYSLVPGRAADPCA